MRTDTALGGVTSVLLDGGLGPATEGTEVIERGPAIVETQQHDQRSPKRHKQTPATSVCMEEIRTVRRSGHTREGRQHHRGSQIP
jgi:hypothetical protein